MKRNGYTLIEILVVLAITAILSTIGYIGAQSYAKQQALFATVRTLQTDLRSTQQLAVTGNKPTGCTTLLNGYQFRVLSTTTYRIDAYCSVNSVNGTTKTLNSDFRISTPTPNPITFKTISQGTNIPANSSAALVVSQVSTGKTVTITIGANGSIQ